MIYISQYLFLYRQSHVWGIADIICLTKSFLHLGNAKSITCDVSCLIHELFSNWIWTQSLSSILKSRFSLVKTVVNWQS
jgi:hypothetical protein